MKVADMMKPDGRVFLKSVFGQISNEWPCMSFSRPSVGEMLRQDFIPGRDVMIYVGTLNRELTENPDHRSRLIASVVIEPSQVLETRRIISREYWSEYGERWPLSMPVLSAAVMNGPPFPKAHDIIPDAYSRFGKVENRGGVVEAIDKEREAVRALNVVTLELHLSSDVQAYINIRTSLSETPRSIRQEATRMANLIIARVNSGGEERVVKNPLRTAPNLSDLFPMLTRKWQVDQHGLCALCGGVLVAATMNKMLQASADRIDSTNGSYDEKNVHVTHLACNLAKNKYGVGNFEEWLMALRGTSPSED
ncbi:hypothetical protein [Lichenicoccus sp.]|uniref:hypothetical protein n=1 Tax=Lichenicoccus sp. TaxID=2781899 RepID=UPI003D09CE9C